MVTLSGAGLVLRPLGRKDKDEWNALRWENRDWLAPWESQDPRGPENLPTFHEYVRAQAKAAREQSSFAWVITEGGPILGHITLSHISWGATCSGTIGYWVSHHRAGEGITPRAVAVATVLAFGELGLHRGEFDNRPLTTARAAAVVTEVFREAGMAEQMILM